MAGGGGMGCAGPPSDSTSTWWQCAVERILVGATLGLTALSGPLPPPWRGWVDVGRVSCSRLRRAGQAGP